MDIIVEGVGKKYYTPDEVEIRLEFYTKASSYQEALEHGTKEVEIFINEVLKEINFDKDLMKTRAFRVCEETKFDYQKQQEIKLGYAYMQEATMIFDYSMNTMAEFMNKVSKLANPPKYFISFNVKDINKCKKEVLADAYNAAKIKAEAISMAAKKELKECVKIDFRPFEKDIISNSRIDSIATMDGVNIQDTIRTIFTPEDIEITETLYCLWITN